jgi:hypothetical protein
LLVISLSRSQVLPGNAPFRFYLNIALRQSLIYCIPSWRFSATTNLNSNYRLLPQFSQKKIDPPSGGKEKKKKKVKKGKKGKKRIRVTESSQHRTPPEN